MIRLCISKNTCVVYNGDCIWWKLWSMWLRTLCVSHFSWPPPPELMWVRQSFTFVCLVYMFAMCEQMSQCFSWYTVKVLPFPVVVVCVAAEKGWTQPVSHKPFSSLRLLSGPGSPKTRAFTLHCARYSSQHSTHGHVSVFIALNINFHSHHAYMGYFLISVPFSFLIHLFNC